MRKDNTLSHEQLYVLDSLPVLRTASETGKH